MIDGILLFCIQYDIAKQGCRVSPRVRRTVLKSCFSFVIFGYDVAATKRGHGGSHQRRVRRRFRRSGGGGGGGGTGGAHLRRAAGLLLPVRQHGLLVLQPLPQHQHLHDDHVHHHGHRAELHPARLLLHRRHVQHLHQPVRPPEARRPHRRLGLRRSHRSVRGRAVSRCPWLTWNPRRRHFFFGSESFARSILIEIGQRIMILVFRGFAESNRARLRTI